MADYILLEAGGKLELENGTGFVLLEIQAPPTPGDYLVQEVDGASRFTLEDGSGFILLEAAGPAPSQGVPVGGVISVRRRLPGRVRRITDLDEDAAIALTLALRTIRRRVRRDT